LQELTSNDKDKLIIVRVNESEIGKISHSMLTEFNAFDTIAILQISAQRLINEASLEV